MQNCTSWGKMSLTVQQTAYGLTEGCYAHLRNQSYGILNLQLHTIKKSLGDIYASLGSDGIAQVLGSKQVVSSPGLTHMEGLNAVEHLLVDELERSNIA